MRTLARVAALVAVAASAVLLLTAAAASAATPIPRVVGPLPVTAASHPFGGAAWETQPEDLAAHGYVEEEYLVSGTANVYDWSADDKAVVRTAHVPYTTRMLVRRPIDRRRQSGTVVVEPLNPSNRFDLNIGWGLAHDQFMRNGDVWIGFTSKPIAVRALESFDPQRYARLSWANPLSLDDPRNCQHPITLVDPPELTSRATEDGLVWDIFSQIGAWAKSAARSNPLAIRRHGHRRPGVTRAYGFGYSQTGSMMITYINAIAPRVVRSDGAPIYDGYLVTVAGGSFIGSYPLNQCTEVPPVGDPRRSLADAGVPVIQMMSQSDYLIGIDSRRPDGNRYPDLYRHYEMAGAAHATPDELLYSARPQDIVAAGQAVPPMSCDQGPRSRFPSRIFIDAALRNIDLWSRYRIPAPPGRDILVDPGPPPQPVLDRFGNVLGGLRSPYLDVPTATWTASQPGPGFCFIVGYEAPFSQAQLDALYPTHRAYVRKVARDALRLAVRRYLTWPDAVRIIREAAQSSVGG
jgi:hypothetical protein